MLSRVWKRQESHSKGDCVWLQFFLFADLLCTLNLLIQGLRLDMGMNMSAKSCNCKEASSVFART